MTQWGDEHLQYLEIGLTDLWRWIRSWFHR